MGRICHRRTCSRMQLQQMPCMWLWGACAAQQSTPGDERDTHFQLVSAMAPSQAFHLVVIGRCTAQGAGHSCRVCHRHAGMPELELASRRCFQGCWQTLWSCGRHNMLDGAVQDWGHLDGVLSQDLLCAESGHWPAAAFLPHLQHAHPESCSRPVLAMMVFDWKTKSQRHA